MNETINYTSYSYQINALSNLTDPMYLLMHHKLNLPQNTMVEFINERFKRMLVEKMWYETVIIGDSKIIMLDPEDPRRAKKTITSKAELFDAIQHFSIYKKTATAYILRVIRVGSEDIDTRILTRIEHNQLKVFRRYNFTAPFSILKITDQFIQDDE